MPKWKPGAVAIAALCLLVSLAGCASLDGGSTTTTATDLQTFGLDFFRQLLAAFVL